MVDKNQQQSNLAFKLLQMPPRLLSSFSKKPLHPQTVDGGEKLSLYPRWKHGVGEFYPPPSPPSPLALFGDLIKAAEVEGLREGLL